MDEYISREAVIRYLKGFSEKELNSSSNFGMVTSSVLNKAERAISEMPAADVQPVNGWISVKDRLPEPNTVVLVYYDGYGVAMAIYNDGHFQSLISSSISHWRYLPEPPESEVDAE